MLKSPPEQTILDGQELPFGKSTIRAIHTPGHASNHLCFLLEEDGLLLSGDHINSGTTVVINPPDGNMVEYMDALARLQQLPLTFILPAHGHVIGFAHDAIRQLVAHRLGREAKVRKALKEAGPVTLEGLLPFAYNDVKPALFPVAARSLLAHLEKLQEDGEVVCDNEVWRIKA